ncbi:MAG: PQQ-binding-like beta-propeller repeat protein [Verrucomicrobiota bacterium]
MGISDLIFTGFNKRVAALDRHTGQIVWEWTAHSGSSYTSLLLDDDRLIVSVHGYMYALDALTGRQLWFNKMSGFRCGVASLTSVKGSSSHHLIAAAAGAEADASAAAVSVGT